MRSGSSLLLHILATNPDIAGFGESHLCYGDLDDLARLRRRIRRHLPTKKRDRRYALDKILHDHLHLADEVLQHADGRFIVLLREPRSAVASMIHAFPKWFGTTELTHRQRFQRAAGHYHLRLSGLVRTARRIADLNRALFVRHQDLLEETDRVLRTLEDFLGLKAPLSTRYDLLPTTGGVGMGDHSAALKSGVVQHVVRHPMLQGKHPSIRELESVFADACKQLESYCRIVS